MHSKISEVLESKDSKRMGMMVYRYLRLISMESKGGLVRTCEIALGISLTNLIISLFYSSDKFNVSLELRWSTALAIHTQCNEVFLFLE